MDSALLEQHLRDMIVGLTGLPVDFDAHANLYLDLGVPSVQAMSLLMAIEEYFGVSVPDELFVDATSLETLVSMVGGLADAQQTGT